MPESQDKQIRDFVEQLLNMTPNEITLLASLSGMLIGQFLTPNQQNVIGNYFELLGQVILSMVAQGQYVTATREDDYDPKIVNNTYPRTRK